MDFTSEDDQMFPMYVVPGGRLFGFCPGKATWDSEAKELFKLLVISAETGSHYEEGGIANQPNWWIDILSWFLPMYNERRFWTRASKIAESFSSKGPRNTGAGTQPLHRGR